MKYASEQARAQQKTLQDMIKRMLDDEIYFIKEIIVDDTEDCLHVKLYSCKGKLRYETQ